ncbi:hypothetical protein [Aliivibrio fischeri]
MKEITPEQAYQYLTDRSVEVGQKTLDMERQAIQSMMHHVSNKLSTDATLNVIKSESQQILTSRSYTQEQISMVASSQNERNSLSTKIAHTAGLRAHELLTIQRIDERKPDERPALESKFSQRDGLRYTVEGKGGLVREIQIPQYLSERLEQYRLETPSDR